MRIRKKELWMTLLNQTIETEDYETACIVRDQLLIMDEDEFIEYEEDVPQKFNLN